MSPVRWVSCHYAQSFPWIRVSKTIFEPDRVLIFIKIINSNQQNICWTSDQFRLIRTLMACSGSWCRKNPFPVPVPDRPTPRRGRTTEVGRNFPPEVDERKTGPVFADVQWERLWKGKVEICYCTIARILKLQEMKLPNRPTP